jgi:hypothetical protein
MRGVVKAVSTKKDRAAGGEKEVGREVGGRV